jgi:hypothetical protein
MIEWMFQNEIEETQFQSRRPMLIWESLSRMFM